MADATKYTETTEVKTETEQDTGTARNSEYKRETTVTTEKQVEKEPDPVVIIEHKS